MRVFSRVTSFVLLSFVLFGCGTASQLDPTFAFDATSEKSVVIGGADASKNKDFEGMLLTFKQYDPESQRLVPGGSSFFIGDNWIVQDGLTLVQVNPGHYIMTLYNAGRHPYAIASPDKTSVGFVLDDARVGGVKSFRFKVDPGEVVYMGEYVVGAFKPKWEDRSEEVRELLSKMPDFDAPFVFRPPMGGAQ